MVSGYLPIKLYRFVEIHTSKLKPGSLSSTVYTVRSGTPRANTGVPFLSEPLLTDFLF